ncbi:MAG: hypothetical protein WCK37_02925 [Candidatus Falkowbacteria bacterium]
MKKLATSISLMLTITLISLSSCKKDDSITPTTSNSDKSNKIIFYGKINNTSSDGYVIFFKAKSDNQYYSLFEVGKYGDFYKEYKKSDEQYSIYTSSGFYGYKIGEKFPIMVNGKDTTIILSANNEIIIRL